MTFSILCDCGKRMEVTGSQAGTDMVCSCGRTVSIPLLSQLRQMAGKDAYEAGTIDTINRMIREGELPPGDTCVISGLETSGFYNLYVHCETTWVRGGGVKRHFFVIATILFLPFWLLWALLGWALLDDKRQELGRDRGVYAPLRVRPEHYRRLSRIRSQKELRKLLRTVPIYATLLDEYPKATIRT